MLKRTFDLFVSFFGLILIIPVLITIAIAIKIKMPGRVFFRQKRVGQYGRIFTIVKFRTMVEGHNGNQITVSGEERITSFGKWMRRYKIDELPELWNVFIGDMSLVGPRPDVPGYADRLLGESKDILKLKPGITGPATLKYSHEEEILASVPDPVRYNDEVIYPDKIRINLNYLRTRSITVDIWIVMITVYFLFRKIFIALFRK